MLLELHAKKVKVMRIKSPKMLFFGIILSDCITFGTVKQPLKKIFAL